jgi:hypothetical protein
MIGELDLYGVFVPPLLLMVIASMPLAAAVRLVLTGLGFYRFVWHRPLFDLSVFVIILGGVCFLIEHAGFR